MPDLAAPRIMVRLKDPSSTDTVTGEVVYHADIADWTELTVLHPEQCPHEVTACSDCASDWAADYHVKISGDDGATWYGITDVPGIPRLTDD